jgi:hypothetical protein
MVVLAAAACSGPATSSYDPTFATPASLTTTATLPTPYVADTDPIGIATKFITAYAGGDNQRACEVTEADIEPQLESGCNFVQKMEKLPQVTLQDSCQLSVKPEIVYRARFRVVPGAGQVQLPIRGEPQYLEFTVRSLDGNRFQVNQLPQPYDPATGCTDAAA